MIVFFQKSLLFFALILVQLFFIDQMDLGTVNFFFSPLIYGLIIICLPPSIEIWLLMIIAMLMGFSVDLFRNTIGLNMSSLVVVAFLKNPLLNTIFSKDGYDPLKELNFVTIGWSNFLFFSLVMVFIHHFWFFTIEDFHFNKIHVLLLKSIVNSIFSVGIFSLVHLITINRN